MTEDNNILFLALAIGVPVAFYWLQIIRRSKELLRFKVQRILLYLAVFLVAVGTVPRYGYSFSEAAFVGIVVGALAAFLFVNPPKQSRRIPVGIRRAVIARDLKGEPFNASIHDIDHIVPFSKGGDHSLANLRVVTRSQNRSRGAKMPKFRDLV